MLIQMGQVEKLASLTAGQEHRRTGRQYSRCVELVVEVLEVRVAREHPVEDGEGGIHCRGVLRRNTQPIFIAVSRGAHRERKLVKTALNLAPEK